MVQCICKKIKLAATKPKATGSSPSALQPPSTPCIGDTECFNLPNPPCSTARFSLSCSSHFHFPMFTSTIKGRNKHWCELTEWELTEWEYDVSDHAQVSRLSSTISECKCTCVYLGGRLDCRGEWHQSASSHLLISSSSAFSRVSLTFSIISYLHTRSTIWGCVWGEEKST